MMSEAAAESDGTLVHTKDVFAQFQNDWKKAMEAKDQNAPFCTLATIEVDDDNNHGTPFPRMRTVGLREVDAKNGTLLLFINDTCPKFQQLRKANNFEVLTFWTSPAMIQYRIAGKSWSTLDTQDMEQRWRNKPKMSQLLDYYYSHVQPQSSVLTGGRPEFVAAMQSLQHEFAHKEVPFQPIATGIVLKVCMVEEWRGSITDRLHERYRYQKQALGNIWKKQALAP